MQTIKIAKFGFYNSTSFLIHHNDRYHNRDWWRVCWVTKTKRTEQSLVRRRSGGCRLPGGNPCKSSKYFWKSDEYSIRWCHWTTSDCSNLLPISDGSQSERNTQEWFIPPKLRWNRRSVFIFERIISTSTPTHWFWVQLMYPELYYYTKIVQTLDKIVFFSKI